MATNTAQSNESYLASYLNGFLQQQGFTGQNLLQAEAAILGNIQAESGFSPTALARNDGGPGVDAHGIVQWEGGRYSNLVSFAKSIGLDPSSIQAQAQFLGKELSGHYSNVLTSLKGATSENQAAQIVQAHYEVSSPASLGKRQSYAGTIYGQLTSGATLSGGGQTNATPATFTSAQGAVGSGLLPGPLGPALDPFGILPGDKSAAGSILGSVGSDIVGAAEDLAKPLVKWLLNAFLVVTGIIVVIIAVVLLAKDADDHVAGDGETTAPSRGEGRAGEESKGGAEHDAEDAAVAE